MDVEWFTLFFSGFQFSRSPEASTETAWPAAAHRGGAGIQGVRCGVLLPC